MSEMAASLFLAEVSLNEKPMSKIKILHVDDDPCILEVSKQILEVENNFEVDTALSVEEAFKRMEKQSFDVVVSDYVMPQKNGLQFLQELREKRNLIPFIMFTGKSREEVAVKALNLGADGYYNKQGSPETVFGELSHGIHLAAERMKAKSALEESEKRYRTLMEQAAEAIFVHDTKGQVVDVNQHACKSLGYTREELLSMNLADIDAEATENKKGGLFWPKALAGQSVTFESTHKRKDGSTFPVEVTLGSTTLNKEIAVIGLVRDITERKKMEESLEKERQELDCIVDSSPIIIFYKDKEGKFLRVNKSFAEALQMPQEEFVGKTVFDFYSAEIAQSMANDDLEVLKSGCPKLGIIEQYESASGLRWVQTDKVPILDENGVPNGIIGFAQDITERKKMEDALRQDQDMLEAITENLGAGFVTISKDYRVLYANRFVKNNVGDAEGKHCYATLNTLDHICPDCGVKKVFEDGVAKDSHEYSQMGIDGKPYYVELIATPLKDKDGNVTAALEFVVDIAEKKRMQQTLQANEAKFRAISDSAIDAIFMFNEEDRITYWNPAAERIFGYTEKEIVGEKVGATIVPPRFHKDHLKLTSEPGKVENMKKNAGEILEFPAFRKDGTEFSMELSMAPLQLEGKRYFVAIARDVTYRKKAEEERESSENYLKAIFKSVLTGIIIINAETHEIVDVNPQALETLGTSKEQTVGKICHKFVCPAEKGKCPISDLGQVVDKSERTLLSLDGEKIPILKTVVEMSWKGQKYLVESFINITDRKKAEEALNQVMDQLVLVNEKVEVVGSLTRHDVRNKLSAMTGYAYLLKKKHADQADILDGVSKMEQAVKDIVAIFDFAKMYEQLGVEELTYINAEKALNEAIALFSGLSSLEFINDCHGLSLMADSLLTQLFYNLIDNSLKHGKKVTKIRVHYEKADQDKLIVVYEDDGVGISAENKSKLFKEGFSTSGTSGHGLFLLRKMMGVYGWSIQENGEPGKGAKFTMTIPRINQNGKENFQIA
jgi:PAS domain S-box-containing protein